MTGTSTGDAQSFKRTRRHALRRASCLACHPQRAPATLRTTITCECSTHMAMNRSERFKPYCSRRRVAHPPALESFAFVAHSPLLSSPRECTATQRHSNDGQGRCPASILAVGGRVRLPTVSPVDFDRIGASTRCAAAASSPDPSSIQSAPSRPFGRMLLAHPPSVAGAASLLETADSDRGSTRYLPGLAHATAATITELSVGLRGVLRQVHSSDVIAPTACDCSANAAARTRYRRRRRHAVQPSRLCRP